MPWIAACSPINPGGITSGLKDVTDVTKRIGEFVAGSITSVLKSRRNTPPTPARPTPGGAIPPAAAIAVVPAGGPNTLMANNEPLAVGPIVFRLVYAFDCGSHGEVPPRISA